MYSKFGTRRSTFQKRTYKILISDFKLSNKKLSTKPNKAFHCPPSVYEHAWLRTWACRFILIRVTVTPITAPSFPTVDWWQTENLIKFQTSLMQFNMFKIQFKDYLHSLFHFPSLKSISDPNLYLHVHLFHLYQRIRQFEFKKIDLFPCQRLQTQVVEKTQRDCNMKGQFKSCWTPRSFISGFFQPKSNSRFAQRRSLQHDLMTS